MLRRRAVAFVLALLVPVAARAAGGTHDVGNVAVIDDALTGGKIVDGCNPLNANGLPNPGCYCQEAAKVFYQTHCDDYDALVVFVDEAPQGQAGFFTDVDQGTPVKTATSGIGRQPFDWTALYGSAGRLWQCVNMTYLTTKPDNPDADVINTDFVLPIDTGITGIELLGHEFGHHWLMGANYDKGDGNGVMDLLRACDTGSNTDGTCDPNLHYAEFANSHSVMYGNFLTDNGDGTFKVCGGVRGYSKLDQYLMGLLPASKAPDPIIWALDDGSHHGAQQDGGDKRGTCRTIPASGSNLTYTRVNVSVQDVIRALGPRKGPAAEIPTNWNVGFILVAPSSVTPTQAQIDKVDTYRSRFENWFTTATDGLGHVHTQIQPNDCVLPPPPPPPPPTDGGIPDAGPPPIDAGVPDAGPPPPVDAGTPDAGPPPPVDAGTPDAGPPILDAGTPDAGVPDGGDPHGCGIIPCADGGQTSETPDAGPGIKTLKTGGCGCSATSASGTVVPALAFLLLLGLRRRRRA